MNRFRLKVASVVMLPFFYSGYLSALDFIAKFDKQYRGKVKEAKLSNFSLDKEILNRGDIQIWGVTIKKDEFLNEQNNGYKIFKDLDQLRSKIFAVKDEFKHVALSKQAYLLKGITTEDFGRGIDIFKDPAYQAANYSNQDLLFPDDPSVEYSFISVRKIEVPFIKFHLFNVQDAVSKVYHKKYIAEEEFDCAEQKLIKEINLLGLPKMVAITHILDSYRKNNKNILAMEKPHGLFFGSMSWTSYFPVNENNDMLVVTYQIAKLASPIPSIFYGFARSSYAQETANGINNSRRYFYSKKA